VLSNKGLSENYPLLAEGRPAKIEALKERGEAKERSCFCRTQLSETLKLSENSGAVSARQAFEGKIKRKAPDFFV